MWEQLKILIDYFWVRINSFSFSVDQKSEQYYVIVDLNEKEIMNLDKMQDKYLNYIDDKDSVGYLSDIELYDRLLRLLKREELVTSERLLIIDVLSKYKKYLELND